jgi:KDO2-lipid IV(A) lauroyltransferase
LSDFCPSLGPSGSAWGWGCCTGGSAPGAYALARPTKNPLVSRWLGRIRAGFGIHVLSTAEGVRPIVKALKRNAPVAILIDQHVRKAFVEATLFGRPAATTAVPVSLALRMNRPVGIAYAVREPRSFRYQAHVIGPVELQQTGDRDADIAINTQMLNDRAEEIIRRHPEQWLWTHRRWKLADRAGAEAADAR